MTLILFAYALILILLLMDVLLDAKKRLYLPMKMLCSLMFLLVFARRHYLYPHSNGADFSTGLALFFCFLGDYFMALYNVRRKKRFMVAGILTFMSAHLAFLVRFYLDFPGFWITDLLVPLACVLLCALTMQHFHLHLGRLRLPALVYSFFVSLLLSKGLRILFQSSLGATPLSIGAASALFWISDFSLIFIYFYHYKNRPLQKASHVGNLLTYYMAVCLLAL